MMIRSVSGMEIRRRIEKKWKYWDSSIKPGEIVFFNRS